jgi:hypothetical protein
MALLGSEIATTATLAINAMMILRDMTFLPAKCANPSFACLVGSLAQPDGWASDTMGSRSSCRWTYQPFASL